jgi:hypothetical protein
MDICPCCRFGFCGFIRNQRLMFRQLELYICRLGFATAFTDLRGARIYPLAVRTGPYEFNITDLLPGHTLDSSF